MKNSIFTHDGAALAVAVVLAVSGAVQAQTVTTTREVTTNGTISSFEPQGFVVRSEAAGPTTYSYNKSTQYVDEAGNVITRESITPETPVTVHYVREGDQLTADRVVVHKTTTTTIPGRPLTHKEEKALREAREHPEREARRAAEKGKPFPPEDPSQSRTITTETTTSSDGTVGSLTPDQFVVQSGGGERIVYRVSRTTQYVDESGAPVSMEVVRSGVPVTVSYATEGSGRMAQRVVVHTRVSR